MGSDVTLPAGCSLPDDSATVESVRYVRRKRCDDSECAQELFSIVAPGGHLKPHCGPSNGFLNIHLPLIVPMGSWIRVGAPPWRMWTEGEPVVFDDSFEHEVTVDRSA